MRKIETVTAAANFIEATDLTAEAIAESMQIDEAGIEQDPAQWPEANIFVEVDEVTLMLQAGNDGRVAFHDDKAAGESHDLDGVSFGHGALIDEIDERDDLVKAFRTLDLIEGVAQGVYTHKYAKQVKEARDEQDRILAESAEIERQLEE